MTEALSHKRKVDRVDPEDADGIKKVCGVEAQDIVSLTAGAASSSGVTTLLQMIRDATSQQ